MRNMEVIHDILIKLFSSTERLSTFQLIVLDVHHATLLFWLNSSLSPVPSFEKPLYATYPAPNSR